MDCRLPTAVRGFFDGRNYRSIRSKIKIGVCGDGCSDLFSDRECPDVVRFGKFGNTEDTGPAELEKMSPNSYHNIIGNPRNSAPGSSSEPAAIIRDDSRQNLTVFRDPVNSSRGSKDSAGSR